MRRPRRAAAKAGGPAGGGGGGGEASVEAVVAVGVEDAEGVAVIAVGGEGDVSVLGVPVAAAAGDGSGAKGPLEDALAVVAKVAAGVPVIAIGGDGEAPVLGIPVVAVAGGGEKGPLEDVIAVGEKDALDGAPGIATDGKGEVPVQGDPVVPAADRKVDVPATKGVQAIAVKGNGKAEKDEEGIKWLKHYSSAQSILIVGDGDFSFSLALATAFGSGENLVATSLDSYGALTSKYAKAEANITELKRLDATVLHGVDAKTMKLHSWLNNRKFDRIVYNFPHAGFKGKEDHLHVINAHKQLVHGFFSNARHLLRPYGETHLSHKTGHPYDAWDIEQLANDSGLILVGRPDFCKEDYPGYNQKRGDSAKCDQPFALGPCCTFMFCLGDAKKLKKARRNRAGSISFLGDSKFYPGVLGTGMSPFDLRPLPPAWPQPHFPAVNGAHMPIPFDPHPFGVAPMEHSGFPVNFSPAAPYFNQQQDMVQAMCRGAPLRNVFPSQGGFHPPMSRILAYPEQPWYQEGPPIVPPWRGDYYSYSSREDHQSLLRRDYEIHRQKTMALEQSCVESFHRKARLEMLIEFYGRQ